MHVDESPMKSTEWLSYDADPANPELECVEGKSSLIYFRTYSNAGYTRLRVHKRKDIPGVDRDKLLPRFHGLLSHDHDRKYYNYGLNMRLAASMSCAS